MNRSPRARPKLLLNPNRSLDLGVNTAPTYPDQAPWHPATLNQSLQTSSAPRCKPKAGPNLQMYQKTGYRALQTEPVSGLSASSNPFMHKPGLACTLSFLDSAQKTMRKLWLRFRRYATYRHSSPKPSFHLRPDKRIPER